MSKKYTQYKNSTSKQIHFSNINYAETMWELQRCNFFKIVFKLWRTRLKKFDE